jgi:subtilisin family serine protease
MSWGFYRRSRVLEDALQYALDHDAVLVASAGNNHARNEPKTAPHLPSTYPGVIEVAAVDHDAVAARFSNFGRTVSVAAPGVDILSSVPGGYELKSGTSMAAPHVAGVAALVRSQFPELGWQAVKQRLEATARDLGEAGPDEVYGAGLVDAAAALGL